MYPGAFTPRLLFNHFTAVVDSAFAIRPRLSFHNHTTLSVRSGIASNRRELVCTDYMPTLCPVPPVAKSITKGMSFCLSRIVSFHFKMGRETVSVKRRLSDLQLNIFIRCYRKLISGKLIGRWTQQSKLPHCHVLIVRTSCFTHSWIACRGSTCLQKTIYFFRPRHPLDITTSTHTDIDLDTSHSNRQQLTAVFTHRQPLFRSPRYHLLAITWHLFKPVSSTHLPSPRDRFTTH